MAPFTHDTVAARRSREGLSRFFVAVMATVFVFGPAAAWAVGVRPKAIENRPLAAAPSPADGWESLDAAAPWATDHLPGRARAVHVNAWIDFHVLGELPAGLAPPQAASAGQGGSRSGSTANPMVVRGRHGYLYLGQDFAFACRDRAHFATQLDSFLKIADIIEASGRKVVIASGPNKSSVAVDDLPRAVPRGDCAVQGLREQSAVMKARTDPRFLDVTPSLIDSYRRGKLPFWRSDTHWSPTGSGLYGLELAKRLKPALAASITFSEVHRTIAGDLDKLIGLETTERAPVDILSTGAKVTLEPFKPGLIKDGVYYGRQHWTSAPSAGLVPGKTLLLGDSYTYYGAGSLRPLFADGTFLWTSHVSEADIIAGLKESDTVVFEVVERALGANHLYTIPRFQKKVATALGVPAP